MNNTKTERVKVFFSAKNHGGFMEAEMDIPLDIADCLRRNPKSKDWYDIFCNNKDRYWQGIDYLLGVLASTFGIAGWKYEKWTRGYPGFNNEPIKILTISPLEVKNNQKPQ